MSVQANGDPTAMVPATIQTPKAIIPAEIRNESVVFMLWSLFGVHQCPRGLNRTCWDSFQIYLSLIGGRRCFEIRTVSNTGQRRGG